MKQTDWMKVIKRTGMILCAVLLALIAVSGVIGWMLSKEWIDITTAILITNVLQIILIFVVSFSACKQTPRSKLIIGLCTSCVFVCVSLLLKGLFFPREAVELGIVFWLCVLTAIPASIAASQKKIRKR